MLIKLRGGLRMRLYRPCACATKNGKKGSTQMTMAVYAAENVIEVESSGSNC